MQNISVNQIQERLEDYLCKISFCIRTNDTNEEPLRDLLISAYYFLRQINITPKVKIQHKIQYENNLTDVCVLCSTIQYNIITPCGHKSCRACLKSYFLHKTSGTLLGKIHCFECESEIPSNLIYKVFGSVKIVSNIRKASGYIPILSMFRCEICTNDYPVEEGITIECDHRFCEPCLKAYMNDLICTNKVADTEFCCPKCPTEIDANIVQGLFSAENEKHLYHRYLDFKANYFKPKSDDFAFKRCPFCETFMEISVKSKEITCVGCKKVYCPQCNTLHQGKLCENYIKSHSENEKVNSEAEKLCPKCKEGIDKENGCNFVQCPWPKCKNTFFCYLCLKVLTRMQHYNHYSSQGPYGNTCNTLEGIKE